MIKYCDLSEEEKDKRREACRRWASKVDRTAYYKQYDKERTNKKERTEAFKKMRNENPEYWRKYSNKKYHENKNNDRPSNKKEYKLWWSAKKRATKKDIPFSIEREDVIIPDVCPCCKEEMSRPSLDQIKPGEGYTKENVAVICLSCNTIKSFGTSDQHRRIAEWMDEVTV